MINVNDAEIIKMMKELELEKDSGKFDEVVVMQNNYPDIEPGTYDAIVANAEITRKARSMYGINDNIKVTYYVFKEEDGAKEKVEIKQTYWQSKTESSAYYRYLKELLGKDPRKPFSIKELIGVGCRVVIKHNTTANGVYANIDKVARASLNTNLEYVEI